MQVDLSLVAGLASVVVGGYVAILRYTIFAKERELERRFDELGRTQLRAQEDCIATWSRIDARLNSEEKHTIRQDGEIQLVKQSHEQLYGDIEEIKRTMVTKSEWEQRMTGVERTLGQILSDLRNAMGRYSAVGHQAQGQSVSPYNPSGRKPGT